MFNRNVYVYLVILVFQIYPLGLFLLLSCFLSTLGAATLTIATVLLFLLASHTLELVCRKRETQNRY